MDAARCTVKVDSMAGRVHDGDTARSPSLVLNSHRSGHTELAAVAPAGLKAPRACCRREDKVVVAVRQAGVVGGIRPLYSDADRCVEGT